ncbi:ATP-binding protein [Aquiflexum sp. TKW24L]|uniref:sensor histidine kinase n=1 Tax=Aquiflexum sp. TKW24L TaxID=2942212 RepID=UPI0020BE5ACF|nr:ATP-binding protein [Aquiflexum sp. TKW24L]MCL6261055.1 ATP-binding protein [Aquiflexum sp. TKW24L]
MEKNTKEFKIILSCNKDAIVEQVFLDTGSFLENLKLPVALYSIFSQESISDLGSLWLTILEKSMVRDTILSMNHDGKTIDLLFSGYLLDEKVLLCGNTELNSNAKALRELMLINNEQANQIRLSEKKADKILNKIEKSELDDVFLNDFTALNNDLINNKRDLMRKNKEIELLNKELKDVNENITMFSYSLSHDLKEPVRMINSFLSMFQNKYGDSLDEKGQRYINQALDGADRLSKMMADLLEYHQSSNFDATGSVDLNEVILEVKKILQKNIEEKNAQIISKKLPVLQGSYTGFLLVFQNLISNAIKFVPEEIIPIVSIDVKENETYFTFMVKDNGIGIVENQREEAFHLFRRLNSPKAYEGTGMGLAMVKKSIGRMGGEVWIESEEGKGTTVCFTIKKSS